MATSLRPLTASPSRRPWPPARQGASFVMANSTRIVHLDSMTISGDVHRHTAEQGANEEETLKGDIKAQSERFITKGHGGLREGFSRGLLLTTIERECA